MKSIFYFSFSKGYRYINHLFIWKFLVNTAEQARGLPDIIQLFRFIPFYEITLTYFYPYPVSFIGVKYVCMYVLAEVYIHE